MNPMPGPLDPTGGDQWSNVGTNEPEPFLRIVHKITKLCFLNFVLQCLPIILRKETVIFFEHYSLQVENKKSGSMGPHSPLRWVPVGLPEEKWKIPVLFLINSLINYIIAEHDLHKWFMFDRCVCLKYGTTVWYLCKLNGSIESKIFAEVFWRQECAFWILKND